MSRAGTVWRRCVSALVGSVLVAGLLAGCTNARSSLGTGDSSCFLDLAAAAQAVHMRGTFVGIHLFSLSHLNKTAPRLVSDLKQSGATATNVCVAAYQGHFTAAQVTKPIGTSQSGRMAIVVVDSATKALEGTDIIKRAPLHFGHPHLG